MSRIRLLALLALLLPTVATAQDADGDLFTAAQGDCDDGDAAAYPGATEVCDGTDQDCDGLIDEPGASPYQCDPFPILVEAPDNSSTPGGVVTNVQSLLVRNWMGPNSSNVLVNATLTLPAGVTVLGWVIDFGTQTANNRALDSTFSVTGGSLAVTTNNTWFELGTQDWAWVSGNQAGFRSLIGTAADEARLIVSYDPALVGALDVTVNMGGGIIRDLSWCGNDMPGLTNHTFPLTTADDDLLDDDGDGFTECDGDCDDSSAALAPGLPEVCDGLDNDCDGLVPTGEIDDDGDGVSECEGDCDDGDPNVVPGGAELCDGLDNGCGGISTATTPNRRPIPARPRSATASTTTATASSSATSSTTTATGSGGAAATATTAIPASSPSRSRRATASTTTATE
jgi:hypothetical protein